VIGTGLVARNDSRLRVRGILREDALELVDQLAKRPGQATPTR
jgi:hypothetical protein